MNIKILGTGCAKCVNLEKKVREIVNINKIDATIEKITDLQEIMKFGIMMTPGLVVNDKVVSYGSIPKDNQILQWLGEAK
ncbi:MAG: glutaredoxin [Ignavibacteria bacterium GWB2_35_12]|nr:MAG: glutaredoxin [Ignavibacteria bacterium GWB2_35_12]OGU87890.1 MAG: glutaredoxin [Ignavibacteria bacterium RIFOXYA2_FULL_35_10]OGV21751.1 MAG: glutaredoxin [Ignavibacteria bacterium RIFOXYC2_FULL_35_21]